MDLSQFNIRTYDAGNSYQMKPAIICNDGFRMSVQGSSFHYCEPRQTVIDYYEMEVGFPSIDEPLLARWAEGPESPTQTVYGYVPSSIIQEVIDKHGGINELETFKNK